MFDVVDPNSEAEFEPELQKPLIQRGRPSERRQGDDIARRIYGRRAVQSDYVRAVEDIGRFGDEFEFHALAHREQSRVSNVELRRAGARSVLRPMNSGH